MISNYSHDHIALDTMNIMANGQYIDQIMTNNQFYIFILGVKVSRQVWEIERNSRLVNSYFACTHVFDPNFSNLLSEFYENSKFNRFHGFFDRSKI